MPQRVACKKAPDSEQVPQPTGASPGFAYDCISYYSRGRTQACKVKPDDGYICRPAYLEP